MEGNEDDLGPIDVLVIGYPPGAPMTGEAVPILLDLVDRGIVRVLDAMVVRKDGGGAVLRVDLAELDAATAGDLTALDGASTGLLDDGDAARVGAEIEPGGTAVTIVYENRWAGAFISAVRRSGGAPIASQRIGVQELLSALDAAEAAS
jgi:hypothetical protein